VAKGVAEQLGFDLFHQEVIHEMAKSAQVSNRLVETLDEKGLSMIEDWISATISERHLWPDEYLKHLLKVIGAIAGHGQAVLVGRGSNFLIPEGKRFRVRIIAPREVRIKYMMRDYDLTAEEAKSRIIKTESDRRAFIRKYFHADIAEPANYDLIINTGTVAIEDAAKTICCAIGK
jgi:cytidylate kinase